ncbi:hypothetical protein [Paenibacillus xylanexedens]|uniref:hypothetical protein n=1 Tax=Paenibacillus xylanexedens TaxID=528191 RepID=UPI0011A0A4E0|nr:hypothetical protein [Paenibacillus xylanexedens]
MEQLVGVSGTDHSSDRWLSPDFWIPLLRGKSADKRERFASPESIPSPPLRCCLWLLLQSMLSRHWSSRVDLGQLVGVPGTDHSFDRWLSSDFLDSPLKGKIRGQLMLPM